MIANPVSTSKAQGKVDKLIKITSFNPSNIKSVELELKNKKKKKLKK